MNDQLTETMVRLVRQALDDLSNAIVELSRPTKPSTPIPTPKFFRITPNAVWPRIEEDHVNWWDIAHTKKFSSTFTGYADILVEDCKYQPRKVMEAVKTIRAAAEWCRKRAEGRRRHAQEILRQQKKWLEELLTEDILGKLKE